MASVSFSMPLRPASACPFSPNHLFVFIIHRSPFLNEYWRLFTHCSTHPLWLGAMSVWLAGISVCNICVIYMYIHITKCILLCLVLAVLLKTCSSLPCTYCTFKNILEFLTYSAFLRQVAQHTRKKPPFTTIHRNNHNKVTKSIMNTQYFLSKMDIRIYLKFLVQCQLCSFWLQRKWVQWFKLRRKRRGLYEVTQKEYAICG